MSNLKSLKPRWWILVVIVLLQQQVVSLAPKAFPVVLPTTGLAVAFPAPPVLRMPLPANPGLPVPTRPLVPLARLRGL